MAIGIDDLNDDLLDEPVIPQHEE
jgi:hypothetical protein